MTRILGGPPLLVIAKLIVLSLIVGAVLSFLGLSPGAIWERAIASARAIWHMGYEAMDNLVEYLLVGAMIVVPVWLIARVLGGRR